jgi:hypothetical protein
MKDHYDFGLRALKSLLVMAGSLKRANPDLPEKIVLIKAMRDSNLPKFLADDVELFTSIIGDLFPGVHAPDQVGCHSIVWACVWHAAPPSGHTGQAMVCHCVQPAFQVRG